MWDLVDMQEVPDRKVVIAAEEEERENQTWIWCSVTQILCASSMSFSRLGVLHSLKSSCIWSFCSSEYTMRIFFCLPEELVVFFWSLFVFGGFRESMECSKTELPGEHEGGWGHGFIG